MKAMCCKLVKKRLGGLLKTTNSVLRLIDDEGVIR
jgi:hypothetical protein